MSDLPTSLTPLILRGHVIDVLRTLPADSIQMVVTSPPYWGLRDYSRCGCATKRHGSSEFKQWGGVSERGESTGQGSVDDPRTIKEPDPNCHWCLGTGQIVGYDQVWGGKPNHVHEWSSTPARRSRSEADATSGIEQASIGGRNYEARGGSICGCGAWFGSLGLEPTPELYVDHLAQVFDEVRRVLREDATLWLNIGDSYAAGGNTGGAGKSADRGAVEPPKKRGIAPQGLKPKDLVGIPWRVAFELQRRGWWLRSDVIWDKPNPMPESVRDRPTRSHEYIFLLTKSDRYHYDQDAVRSPLAELNVDRMEQESFWTQTGGPKDFGKGENPNRSARKALENMARRNGYAPSTIRETIEGYDGKATKSYAGTGAQDPSATKSRIIEGIRSRIEAGLPAGANLKTVWSIATQAYREAHFATFPEAIPERCIRLGTSENGCCAKCGKPRVREVETNHPGDNSSERFTPTHPRPGMRQGRPPTGAGKSPRLTTGWEVACDCEAGTVPCCVLDPFAGSGTTLEVARRLGRRSVGIELNPEYIAMARNRSRADTPGITAWTEPVEMGAK